MRKRYEFSSKKEKFRILTDFCADFDYSRKYAIRILKRTVNPINRRKVGRKPKYGAQEGFHLKRLWELTGRICSKSLASAIVLWLPFYDHPLLDEYVKAKLVGMSPSTIDRLLKQYRCKKWASTTQASNFFLKSKIPIELLRGSARSPGIAEADTVAHCGNAIAGAYIHTLTVTYICTGWTENRGYWRKDADEICCAIKDIESRLPFSLHTFGSDNGTEFLNQQVIDFLQDRTVPVRVVRGRPYKKNDNAHVEQKNWTHVRELFGYKRIDNPILIAPMNHIYEFLWNPLKNFFILSSKLIEKTRIGGKLIKKYDKPKTPYQRLLECTDLSEEAKERLKNRYQKLNPFHLKVELDKALDRFKFQCRNTEFGKTAA